MAENNRNQNQTSGSSTQQDQNYRQSGQTQNTSNQPGQDINPQDGSKWNNYQTRELSDQGAGKEKTSGRENE